MTIGGGFYDSKEEAAKAAIRHFYNRTQIAPGIVPPKLDRDFGVYPAFTNPNVWVWEFPPRS